MSRSGLFTMSTPLMRTRPRSGLSSPTSDFRNTVFPVPEGPSMTLTSPAGRVSVTSCQMFCLPKDLVRPSTTTSIPISPPASLFRVGTADVSGVHRGAHGKSARGARTMGGARHSRGFRSFVTQVTRPIPSFVSGRQPGPRATGGPDGRGPADGRPPRKEDRGRKASFGVRPADAAGPGVERRTGTLRVGNLRRQYQVARLRKEGLRPPGVCHPDDRNELSLCHREA